MNEFLHNVGALLINVIFGIYIFMLLLRLIFQIMRADFYNPLSQAIVKFTNPPLLPLRRIIPGLWGIDLASVVLIFFLQALELWLLLILPPSNIPISLPLLAVITVGYLLKSVVWIFLGAILIRIILSWVMPYGGGQNPVIGLVYSISEPVMRPARRILPPISGLDLSPMLVIVAFSIILMAIDAIFGFR